MPKFVTDETLVSKVSFRPIINNTLDSSVNSRFAVTILKSRQDQWALDSQSLRSSEEKAKEIIASNPGSRAYLDYV